MFIEIKLKDNVAHVDEKCVVCGREFILDFITAELHEEGLSVGEICEECLKGGPEVIREHFNKHADQLIKHSKTIVAELLEDAKQYQEYAKAEIVGADFSAYYKALCDAEKRFMGEG